MLSEARQKNMDKLDKTWGQGGPGPWAPLGSASGVCV